MKPVEITLCRGEGCCPVLSISEKGARITDDNGGEVTITNNELQILKEKLNELDNICQSVTMLDDIPAWLITVRLLPFIIYGIYLGVIYAKPSRQ